LVGSGLGVEGFGSPDAIGSGVGFGAGLAIVTTPLFQTVFLPDFTQVNLVVLVPAFTTWVIPALAHAAPAFGVAAWAGVISPASKRVLATTTVKSLRIESPSKVPE
jgi:hypothetical protein